MQPYPGRYAFITSLALAAPFSVSQSHHNLCGSSWNSPCASAEGLLHEQGGKFIMLQVAASQVSEPCRKGSGWLKISSVLQAYLLPDFHLLWVKLLFSSDLSSFLGMSCVSCLGRLAGFPELRTGFFFCSLN